MAKANNNNSNWDLRREITLGTILHLLAIIGALSAVWSNLQNETTLIRHELDRLVEANVKFQDHLDTLSEQSIHREYRIAILEAKVKQIDSRM